MAHAAKTPELTMHLVELSKNWKLANDLERAQELLAEDQPNQMKETSATKIKG